MRNLIKTEPISPESKKASKSKLFRNVWLISVAGFCLSLVWLFSQPQDVSGDILLLPILLLFATIGIGSLSFVLWVASILNRKLEGVSLTYVQLKSRSKSLIKPLGKLFLILSLLIIITKIFLIDLDQLSGNSMYPNFRDGDYLITDTLTYRFKEPNRTEVIIYKKGGGDRISRIVGLPNEKILVKGGEVFVNENEKALYEPYGAWFEGRENTPTSEVSLREDEYLVINDNRYFVADTQEIIKRKDIKGKVFYRYWPPTSRGLIRN